jgi:hypothetical protein
VTIVQLNLDRVDDIAPLYERFLLILRSAKGWLGVYVVVDAPPATRIFWGYGRRRPKQTRLRTSGAFQIH